MADDSDRIRRAVELLAAEARERLRRHPLGHLAAAESLPLALTLPASLHDGQLSRLAALASADLDLALQGVLDRLRELGPDRLDELDFATVPRVRFVTPDAPSGTNHETEGS